jgi:hypothetical protein
MASQAGRSGWNRYTIIFGAVIAGVTVLAIILALLAPNLDDAGGATVPTNWNVRYQGDFTAPTTTDEKAWDLVSGCAFYSTGLDATPSDSSDALCNFTLAGKGGETDSGFYFEVTVAAPAALPTAYEESTLLIGDLSNQGNSNSLAVYVDQSGTYYVCTTGACGAASSLDQGTPYKTGESAAWHGGGYVANTIGVLVSPDHQTQTLFINHQRVVTVNLSIDSDPAIAIGAQEGTESLYTAATFSTSL